MIIDIVMQYVTGRGGIETAIQIINKELINRGYRVRVVSLIDSTFKEWKREIDEFYAINPDMKDFTINNFIKDYSDFIKYNGKPDIIIANDKTHMSYVCKQVLLNNELEGVVPVVSWAHFSLFAYNNVELIQCADAHFAISEDIAKEFKMLPEQKPVYLIRNPVKFSNNVIPRTKDKLNIIYVGRLHKQKNVGVLFDSLRYVQGDWELNIYGDGPEREMLLNKAQEFGIDDNIVWHGWFEDVWSVVKSASVLVLSSDFEGCPMILMEGLSRGVPIVISKIPGSIDVLKEGKNGWGFEAGDYIGLAKILNNIQSGDFKLPSAQECINSISEYSADNVVDKFESGILLEYFKKTKSYNNKIMAALENIKNDNYLEESLKFLNSCTQDILKNFILDNNLIEYITILNKAAILNYNNENYEYVIPYLQIAYEANSKDIETLYNLSIVLYNMGYYAEALSYLENIEDRNNEILKLEKSLKEKVINIL